MTGLFVPLRLTPGVTGVYLKKISGKDELVVEEANTKSALILIDELLSKDQILQSNIDAAKIVTADRDRILANLYTVIFGTSKIQSTLTCENCEKLFDLDFSLDDLINHYSFESELQSENGIYQVGPDIRFRLPTGEDELLIAGCSQEEAEKILIDKCILSKTSKEDIDKVQLKMAEIAPVFNTEMEAICPECNHSQQARFDIQSYLLLKIKQERPLLLYEIHLIATHYHWSQKEILDLSRKIRKQYAALIESEYKT